MNKRVKNMIGKKCNKLTVVSFKEVKNKNAYWNCICDCGNTCVVSTAKLNSGHTKSCGCIASDTAIKKAEKKVLHKKFGMLLVKKYAYRKGSMNSGSLYWECLCECGNTAYVTTSKLTSGHTRSCGCLLSKTIKETPKSELVKRSKKGHDVHRKKGYFIDSTATYALTSKTPTNNTSGRKGITFDKSRNKWRAQIVFQGKPYFLGRFEKLEDAIKAREEAEEKYFKPILEQTKKSPGT